MPEGHGPQLPILVLEHPLIGRDVLVIIQCLLLLILLFSSQHGADDLPPIPQHLVLFYHLIQFRVFLVDCPVQFLYVFPQNDIGLQKVFYHIDRLDKFFRFEGLRTGCNLLRRRFGLLELDV